MNYQTFEARGCIKFTKEDIYSEGCIPLTGFTNYISDIIVGKTIEELIEKCQDAVGSESKNDLMLDSCEEAGRLDISIMENADGYPATKAEIKAWKENKIKIYNCIYSFRLQLVTREDISLVNPYKMTMTKA